MHKLIAAFLVIIIICTLLVVFYLAKKTETLVNATRQVTLYYNDHCPHCTNMKPVWANVKNALSGSGIIFREINVDKNPTPGIDGVPTILMIDTNGKAYQYSSGPDFNKLRNWMISPNHLY